MQTAVASDDPLVHYIRRCIFVADRVAASPWSNPSKLVTTSSEFTSATSFVVAFSCWHDEPAIEILSKKNDREVGYMSKARFFHPVVDHIDDLECLIELLFSSGFGPLQKSTEIYRGEDEVGKVELRKSSRHGDVNNPGRCS